jgi:cold shock CspA family protein
LARRLSIAWPALFVMRGTIKWYHHKHGYGVITPVGGGEDVLLFDHALSEPDRAVVAEGCEVEFSIVLRKNGPEAVHAWLVGTAGSDRIASEREVRPSSGGAWRRVATERATNT